MPWFRTDDKFHDHRKTRRAVRSAVGKRRDAAAIGLWTLAGTWSSDHLRDGFVPADELDRWDDDGEQLAERLVEAGFWRHAQDEDGEPGYQFINWSEHQPTKADVEAKRAEARERMARVRQERRTSRERSHDVRANTSRTASEVRSAPARPDPTRPSAAAAAEADVRGGGGDAPRVLPGDVDILRSKMGAHVALAGLRWDVEPERLTAISRLIERHGDDELVRWALRTCANPPPRFVSAFIGTWEAIGDIKAVPTVATVVCDTCGLSERSCKKAATNVPEDERHDFHARSA